MAGLRFLAKCPVTQRDLLISNHVWLIKAFEVAACILYFIFPFAVLLQPAVTLNARPAHCSMQNFSACLVVKLCLPCPSPTSHPFCLYSCLHKRRGEQEHPKGQKSQTAQAGLTFPAQISALGHSAQISSPITHSAFLAGIGIRSCASRYPNVGIALQIPQIDTELIVKESTIIEHLASPLPMYGWLQMVDFRALAQLEIFLPLD